MNSNLKFNINPETGLMKLELKKDIFEKNIFFKEYFHDYILPMLSMQNKLVLTGSLSLKLLGFEPLDESIGDVDFGLSDEFTEEDYNNLKNFFSLQISTNDLYFNDEGTLKPFDPKNRLWQFYKKWDEYNDDGTFAMAKGFKMDIFNDEFIRPRDIITIYYDDFEIRLVHPSITYSYRMRYALDVRGNTGFKYWEKMNKLMSNAKDYYKLLRVIQNMIIRIKEHNVSIEGNEEKIQQLRNLVYNRESSMKIFLNQFLSESEYNELYPPHTNLKYHL